MHALKHSYSHQWISFLCLWNEKVRQTSHF